MSVTIELPSELEESVRRQIADLDLAAKEALLIELYRREAITRHELASVLGLDRFSVDRLLTRHGVVEDLPTAAEIRQEAAELQSRLDENLGA